MYVPAAASDCNGNIRFAMIPDLLVRYNMNWFPLLLYARILAFLPNTSTSVTKFVMASTVYVSTSFISLNIESASRTLLPSVLTEEFRGLLVLRSLSACLYGRDEPVASLLAYSTGLVLFRTHTDPRFLVDLFRRDPLGARRFGTVQWVQSGQFALLQTVSLSIVLGEVCFGFPEWDFALAASRWHQGRILQATQEELLETRRVVEMAAR